MCREEYLANFIRRRKAWLAFSPQILAGKTGVLPRGETVRVQEVPAHNFCRKLREEGIECPGDKSFLLEQSGENLPKRFCFSCPVFLFCTAMQRWRCCSDSFNMEHVCRVWFYAALTSLAEPLPSLQSLLHFAFSRPLLGHKIRGYSGPQRFIVHLAKRICKNKMYALQLTLYTVKHRPMLQRF
jgi:hypothetical protein